jgi:hypothetical protein
MDVAGASRAAGAALTIWECLDGPQQTFRWDAATGAIRVYDDTADVKCVDVSGGAPAPGTPLVIQACNGALSQQWEPTADAAGARLVGTNLCLDVPNGTNQLGTQLIVWTCWGGYPQQWDALVVNPTAPVGLYAVYGWGRQAEFRSALAADRCMDVAGASRANFADLTLWHCLDAPQQTFLWDASTREIRVYERTGDTKCLAVLDDAIYTNGSGVVIYDCNGAAGQRWTPGGPGATEIRVAGTSRCLAVRDDNSTPGTRLAIWDCNGAVGQRWLPATVLYATMDGWQPTPNTGSDHQGSGSARFTLLQGDSQVCVNASVTSTRHGDITDAHIHPSPRGEGSPLDIAHWQQPGVLVQGLRGAASSGRECVPVGAASVRRILDDPTSFYFNVHTPDNGRPAGGILRGQLALRP